jgi:hypothetical protein
MDVIRQLFKIAAVALVALLIVAGAMALLFGLGVGGLTVPLTPLGAAAGVFAIAFLAGAGPALLVAPPIYLLFWRSQRATWFSAVIAGAIGGALVGLLDIAVMGYSIAGGVGVAFLTHIGASRWLGPGNSARISPSTPSA